MLGYWQHCLQERGRIATIDNDMFRNFVAQLGTDAKASLDAAKEVSTAKLTELISHFDSVPDKDFLKAMDDIISGIWMRRVDKGQIKINETVLPFAISLALLDELRSSGAYEEADSKCEKFLGPIEDQSIGVDILGAAVSLAFIEPRSPDYIKKVLMKRWVVAHNFNSLHFEKLWRIGGASPEVIFSIAEDLWLNQSGGHSIDEIFIKCIANIATDGDCGPDVIAFMEKWAGTYWLDPKAGQFIGYNPSDEHGAATKAETKRRLEKLRTDLGDDEFAKAGLRCCENGNGASWLSHRIFAIATYLPRALQKSVWRRWVLSRSVMGRPRHFDELAWSLRLNPLDGPVAAQALIETVDELLALQSPSVRRQTLSLLNAHGGPEAAKKLVAIGEPFQTRRYAKLNGEAKLVDGIVDIPDGENSSDRYTAILLSGFAKNPAVEISRDNKERLERYAQDFNVSELSHGRGSTSADIDLEQAEPALARWAPDALAGLRRRFLATINNRDDNGLLGLAFSLDGLLVLLPDNIRQAMVAVLTTRFSGNEDDALGQISRSLWFAAVFDRMASEQYKLWKQIGAPKGVPLTMQHLIRPVTGDILSSLEHDLHPDQEPDRLISWLGYLVSSKTNELPVDWTSLLFPLFNHADETVRSLALQVACESDDGKAARSLYESEWKASPDHGFLENFCGSHLLSLSATSETFDEISHRIDPQFSDRLWKQFDFKPSYRGPFEDFLNKSVERECNPPKTRTLNEYQYSRKEATRKFLEQDCASVTDLADRLFNLEGYFPFSGYQWPFMELLRAFFEQDPDQGVKYWRKMEERKEPIISRSESFDGLLFIPDSGDAVNELRDILVRRAVTDWELMTLGKVIGKHRRAEWAIDWIKQTLAKPKSPGDVARAVTLAGLLDDTEPVKELWSSDLANAPYGGWIEVVHASAKRRIETAWHALHWLDKMFTAKSDEQFFAFWRLFSLSADYRLLPIAARRLRHRPDSVIPRHSNFIDFDWENVVGRTKKEKTKLQESVRTFVYE